MLINTVIDTSKIRRFCSRRDGTLAKAKLQDRASLRTSALRAVKYLAITAAACLLLALEMPGTAAAQPSYVGNGGFVSFYPAVSSITPPMPASPQAGDLLILQMGVSDTVNITAPAPWVLLGTQTYAGYTAALFWAVYTPGMAAPTISWGGDVDYATALISEYTGVGSSPIGAVGAINFNNWGNHTSAAVNTTAANSLVLLSDISADGPNLTTPSGWNQALALNWAGGAVTVDDEVIASPQPF